MSPGDSCRLICTNPYSFVENPFEQNASFNFSKYRDCCLKAQRLMDDLIDLEIECIDKMIEKIKSDPESLEVKTIEINLWNKIKKVCINGRRTGLGVTAIGDTIAALNIKYGSDESIKFVEEIYKTLAQGAYESSFVMAGERGTFPVFDFSLEKGHPFIEQILNSDSRLRELYSKNGKRNICLLTTAPRRKYFLFNSNNFWN